MRELTDSSARRIRYLRVSVTDRCNMRCRYCMPGGGIRMLDPSAILRYEEIVALARCFARSGVDHVRITGGEPLVRRGLGWVIERLAALPGIDDLSMTTNGMLLADRARDLKEAGLKRINVSLDTLRPDRFRWMTRRDGLARVLRGIEAAGAAGLRPVKINTVLIRGFNDDEILSFVRLAHSQPVTVRFIEFMPVEAGPHWSVDQVVSGAEVREMIAGHFGLVPPVGETAGCGPAVAYGLEGGEGGVGFIDAVTDHFCPSCNRLRITSDGKLRLCLLSGMEVDLMPALRDSSDVEQALKRTIGEALACRLHGRSREIAWEKNGNRSMQAIGG